MSLSTKKITEAFSLFVLFNHITCGNSLHETVRIKQNTRIKQTYYWLSNSESYGFKLEYPYLPIFWSPGNVNVIGYSWWQPTQWSYIDWLTRPFWFSIRIAVLWRVPLEVKVSINSSKTWEQILWLVFVTWRCTGN